MIPEIDNGALITIMPASAEARAEPHRLRILGPLGAGGSGCLYLGRLEPEGALRAVKVPRDWTRATEIYHETRYLIGYSHPHVVPIHAIQLALIPRAQHPVPVLLLDLIGGCMAERLVAGAIDANLAMRWIRQIATGLEASSLLHRDLKPENVLIDRHDNAWLCDFGLCLPARAAVRERLGIPALGVVGTPLYMAPEQIYQAADIDQRADIYALGLLLYELLVGEPAHPLHRPTQDEEHYLDALLEAEVPWSRVPIPALAEVVRRCTIKKRRERYQTHAELRAALDAAEASSSPQHPQQPPSPPARDQANGGGGQKPATPPAQPSASAPPPASP